MRITTFVILVFILLFNTTTLFAGNGKGMGKGLPPGLEKKAARGQPLPPGWQKKVEKGNILDRQIISHGEIVTPLDVHGIITINLEGKVLKIHEATRKIIDILKH